MKIISISGLDGSGKSTQIEMLKTYLESQGKKVFYFHAVQFSIANKKSQRNHSREPKSVTKASWFKIQLRKIALVIDLIRFKSLKKNLEKQGYDFLVSDRYFYDNLINITYLESQNGKCSMLHAPCFMAVPRPDYAFYLNTDPEKIMQRDRVPDQGLDYLNKKKELLDAFSAKENLTIINGNEDKETVFKKILSTITIQQ